MKTDLRDERHVVAWVDDDAAYRTLVRDWLEPRYDVREYGDGESFLADLEDLAPDAVILEVKLPDVDGFSLCRKLRERGVAAPVLFLTSSNDPDDFVRHMEVDAAGYLTKPIGRGQLLARLSELVDGERVAAKRPWKKALGCLLGGSQRHSMRGTHKAPSGARFIGRAS